MEAISALLVFWVCGSIAVLVDIDHLVSIVLWRYYNHGITQGRIWHTFIFFVVCLALCGMGTYIGGLHIGFVLMIAGVTTMVLAKSKKVVWRW